MELHSEFIKQGYKKIGKFVRLFIFLYAYSFSSEATPIASSANSS